MLSLVRTFAKYADFTGRAGRGDFWIFFIFFNALTLMANQIDKSDGSFEAVFLRFGLIELIVFLILLLPLLTVGTRRLHDSGRSGWWMLLTYIPYLGWVLSEKGSDAELLCLGGIAVGFAALMVLFALPGNEGENEYGAPDPYAHAIAG